MSGHPKEALVGDAPPGRRNESVGMVTRLPDGGEATAEDLVLVR
jgi:hypothetical protein